MDPRATATRAAFHELLDVLRDADAGFLEGPRAVSDPTAVLEGYVWLTQVLGVALDCHLHADAARPAFVDLTSPIRKWGGDNADAFYQFAPLDPRRSYRVQGDLGDACYASFVVYGGPDDGRWSNRIVGWVHDGQLPTGPGRTFSLRLGPDVRGPGTVRLEPDAVCLVTREYQLDPRAGRRARWTIVAEPPAPPPPPPDDPTIAARFRAVANFLRDLTALCPLPPLGDPNAVQEPYRQQQVTYGWAAPDATYAMGRFALADDEALVLEGRSPACAFWNCCLWNPFLQTFDYRYARVTLNGGQVQLEPDGSWRLVVAARDPGHPNWLSTAGHREGLIWFRWFLADAVPARPTTRVVPLADVPR
jgi:hypothetical protein